MNKFASHPQSKICQSPTRISKRPTNKKRKLPVKVIGKRKSISQSDLPVTRTYSKPISQSNCGKARTLTVQQTATYLDCHPGHVRWLLKRGKLQGTKKELSPNVWYWYVTRASVEKFNKMEQLTGWPRGKAR